MNPRVLAQACNQYNDRPAAKMNGTGRQLAANRAVIGALPEWLVSKQQYYLHWSC